MTGRPATSPELRSALLGIVELRPLPDVLRKLAEAALGLTGADYAAIGAYDEHRQLQNFESFGMSPDERTGAGHPPLGRGLIGEFAVNPVTIRVADFRDHPTSAGMPEGHAHMGAFLGVPVTYGARPIGAFYVTRRPDAPPFSEEDQAQLEALAPYAAIAMMNARTLDLERRRTETAETLARAATGLQDAADERESAQVLLKALLRLFPEAHDAVVCWAGPRGGAAQFVSSGDSEDAAERLANVVEAGIASGEQQIADLDDGPFTVQASDLYDGGQLAVGVVAAASLEGTDRVALRALQQLGVVGFGALWRREAQSALERYALRDAIARDLHDDVIQSIYAVGLGLHSAQPDAAAQERTLERARSELNAVIADLRAYIRQLSGDPDGVTLTHLLATRLRELLAHGGEHPRWTAEIELGDEPLEPSLERQIYLITRELISNVRRHAHAGAASLSLRRDGDSIHLAVADDGVGFDRAAVRSGSVGLRSVEQRVADLDGSMVVETAPGRGTTVIARLPADSAETG